MNFEQATAIVAAGGACSRPSWKGEILIGADHFRLFKDPDTGVEREYKLGDQGYLRRFYPKNHVKYPAGGVDLAFVITDYPADTAANDWEDVTASILGEKAPADLVVAPPKPA